MTVKEASKKFRLSENSIRQAIKQELIPNIYKNGRFYIIPDDIELILSVSQIKHILYQKLKLNNDSNVAISNILTTDLMKTCAVFRLLYHLGYIDDINDFNNAKSSKDIIRNCRLTEEGFNFIIGKNIRNLQLNFCFQPTISVKVGLVNI